MRQRHRDVAVVGFALFAMFLGAGNLIFPPYLGFHAGVNWPGVLAGFVVTGVGLPLLSVFATLKSGGSIVTLGQYLGRRWAQWAGVLIILVIGPLFAIPRTAASVHEVAVRPLLAGVPIWCTTVLFFLVVIFFSLNDSKVIDRIGKILTPFLLVTLFSIVLAGIFNPISTVQRVPHALTATRGFLEGYQTMDALAGIMFAGVALSSVVARGYTKREDQLVITFESGVIAAFLLFLVYGGLLYAGASSGTSFPADIQRTDLLVAITHGLLGRWASLCLAIAVTLACLTTAIGLTVTCGEYFHSLLGDRAPYKTVVWTTVGVSLAISLSGVSEIIKMAVPILVMMYPIMMVLIVMACLDSWIVRKRAYLGAVIGAFVFSLLDAIPALPDMPEALLTRLSALKALLPLGNYGLGWILPALIGGVAAALLLPQRLPGDWADAAEPAVCRAERGDDSPSRELSSD